MGLTNRIYLIFLFAFEHYVNINLGVNKHVRAGDMDLVCLRVSYLLLSCKHQLSNMKPVNTKHLGLVYSAPH